MRALQILQHIRLATCAYTTLIPTPTFKTIVFRRDEQPAVSTVGSSTNGYSSGDVILSIPEADNRVLDQIISQNICPDSKLKKRFVSDCFFENGDAMYGLMRTGGMAGLVDMANAGFELPLPPTELDAGVVGKFDQMGDGIPRLNQQARGRLGRIVWWSQYLTLLAHLPSNNPVKVIPSAVASRVAPAPAATTSARCHYRDRIPYCNNCGGLAGNKDRETCVGFGDLWKTCPCLKHNEPPPPRENLGPEVLHAILEKLRTGNPNITCLGSNATQDMGVWSKLAEKACDHVNNVDQSKAFLREGMSVADIENPGGLDVAAFQRYRYLFRWDPTPNQLCPQTCSKMFTSMAKCGDASKSEMAKTGAAKYTCGTASYKIEDNPPLKVACRGKSLGAPRGNKETESGTSLDKAIEQFCTDNDARSIKKNENVYQRYGITNYGVLDRSSFWLRGAITCGDEMRMKKSECIQALTSGMEQCDPNSGYSHGLAASVGCIDYSIDLSGVTRDDSPPWDQKLTFPPPEDAERPGGGQHEALCTQRGFMVQEKALSNEELTTAIDKFCQNGAEIVGFGRSSPWLDKMFKWPSSDNPRILMGAIFNGEPLPFVNDKANWEPYKDMRWCDNYDWKMGKDDCTFAMRKMHKECTHDRVLKVADFTYRCVRYTYAYPTIET